MRLDVVKIKLLMASRGMNQNDFAIKCGVSRQNIQLTLARGTASAAKINNFAECLEVDAREIIKED